MRSFENSEVFKSLSYKAAQVVINPFQAIWGTVVSGPMAKLYGKELKFLLLNRYLN